MHIQEIREAKQAMEAAIQGMISDFEQATKVIVEHVVLERDQAIGRPDLVRVSIVASL